MASKKAVKKTIVSVTGVAKSSSGAVKKVVPDAGKPPVKVVSEVRGVTVPAAAVLSPLKKSVLPVARTCPLVMDGEMDATDFSPNRCFSCDEFDCRFCSTERGSGPLRSRLFACEESDDGDGDDVWDCDHRDAGEGEDAEGHEGEEDDLF